MEVADSSHDSSNEAEFDRMVQLALAPLEQHDANTNVSLDDNASSISFNEAEFRRKAWLALAPVYEVTLLSSSSDSSEITMACIYQGTDTQIESERSAELDINEADAKIDDTPKPFRLAERAVMILEKWFADHEAHAYPTKEERQELVLATGLTKNQIKWWMERRRNNKKGTTEAITTVRSHHLKKWFAEHESNPYPTKDQKAELALITGFTEDQVRKWFNKERRLKGKCYARGSYERLSKIKKVQLMKWYDKNPYPSKDQLTKLALITGLTEKRVRIWFGNERIRRKKAANDTMAPGEPKSKAYPSKDQRAELALIPGITEDQVRKWFNKEEFNNERHLKGKSHTREYNRLSSATKDHLIKWYEENEANPYPSSEEYKELASTTGMTVRRVRYWFANERIKRKKSANGIITPG